MDPFDLEIPFTSLLRALEQGKDLGVLQKDFFTFKEWLALYALEHLNTTEQVLELSHELDEMVLTGVDPEADYNTWFQQLLDCLTAIDFSQPKVDVIYCVVKVQEIYSLMLLMGSSNRDLQPCECSLGHYQKQKNKILHWMEQSTEVWQFLYPKFKHLQAFVIDVNLPSLMANSPFTVMEVEEEDQELVMARELVHLGGTLGKNDLRYLKQLEEGCFASGEL
jgi:hypothetical protein